jgi:uncharacterized protein (DUF305 family)
MVTFSEPETVLDPAPDEPGRGLRRALVAVIVTACLVLAGAAGYLIGNRNTQSFPSATSVDAGFAWDMSVHHLQAVTMASFVRDHTTDPAVKELAFDIETSQYSQVGQMQGWLDAWGLPAQSTQPQMAWMAGSGHGGLEPDGLMPGMATPAQLTKLESLSGKPLDIYFLQLMMVHHQGGLPMVQWGEQHASESYVRNAAAKMDASQSGELVQMEQMLRQRGASPLPPPAD